MPDFETDCVRINEATVTQKMPVIAKVVPKKLLGSSGGQIVGTAVQNNSPLGRKH